MKYLILIYLFLSLSNSYAGSYLPWRLGYKTVEINKQEVNIRMGYLAANPEVKFKGNVLYYQGLGDSLLNHDPLFEELTASGYRIIAFDYMGQGGSSGNMNNSTIKNINYIGDQVIKTLSRKGSVFGEKYHIIGWSTGGLAAYRKAYLDKGSSILSVTLIAPGIAPNIFVGEGLFNFPIDEITMRTLTNNKFLEGNDPHHDPIFPKSPIYVPRFAFNLQAVALKARLSWSINDKVSGLVLLSGDADTYVNASKTKKVINKKAKHFTIKQYPTALHEIDNEVEKIGKSVREEILKLLNQN